MQTGDKDAKPVDIYLSVRITKAVVSVGPTGTVTATTGGAGKPVMAIRPDVIGRIRTIVGCLQLQRDGLMHQPFAYRE